MLEREHCVCLEMRLATVYTIRLTSRSTSPNALYDDARTALHSTLC